MVTRVVLDVDTGIDDALALLYAVAHPELDLGAVTCVAGDVALRQVVRNTCSVLDLADARQVPIGPGADATLLGQGPRRGHRHGANRLGDLPVQASDRDPQPDNNAIELLRNRLRHTELPLTLLALAPQTNLAMLAREHLEQIAGTVEKLIFVGGRLAMVHPTGPAEFNVGQDPEAAAIVLGAGLPITVRIGLHGAERGRTLIDPAAPNIDVVTAVDAAQAAQRSVDVILDCEE